MLCISILIRSIRTKPSKKIASRGFSLSLCAPYTLTQDTNRMDMMKHHQLLLLLFRPFYSLMKNAPRDVLYSSISSSSSSLKIYMFQQQQPLCSTSEEQHPSVKGNWMGIYSTCYSQESLIVSDRYFY